MTTTRINHRGHDHDNTKAARAICRAEMAKFRHMLDTERVHLNNDMSDAVGSPVSWIRPGTIVRVDGLRGLFTITGFGPMPATADDDLSVYVVDSDGVDYTVIARRLTERVVF